MQAGIAGERCGGEPGGHGTANAIERKVSCVAGAASLPAHLDCDERAAIVDAGDVGVDMAKTQPANASEVSLHYVK